MLSKKKPLAPSRSKLRDLIRHGPARQVINLLALAGFIVALCSTAGAQTCINLQPTGGDDWANIDRCLQNFPHTATLGTGTFTIAQPLVFYADNTTLSDAGRANTTIKAQFSCTEGRVIEAIGLDNITVKDFYLDL